MTVPHHLPPPPPPSIAVIVPTLGRSLVKLLGHLSAQTFRDFCLVVVDQNPIAQWRPAAPVFRDAGVSEYVPVLEGPRGILIHAPWLRGSSAGRNLGLAVAQELGCQGVVFWDDDDAYDPETLACLWALSEQQADAETVACDVVYSTGSTCPRDHFSMASRLWRPDRMGDRASNYGGNVWPRIDDHGPAQDHRFWSQFDVPHYCGHAHVRCGDLQTGGLRDPSGRY